MVERGVLDTELDEQLFILNFGTRLLTAFTDKDVLIPIALETIADFSRGRRVAIMTFDDDYTSMLKLEGIFSDGKPRAARRMIPLKKNLLQKVMCCRSAGFYPLRLNDEVPLPASENESPDGRCLCLPLVGSHFRMVGVTTIELSEQGKLDFQILQQLRVLATVLAISLENAALFAQAVCDGLTGLYVRRYYEIRMGEELAKLRRQPGCVAIVLFDLDRFKNVNDRYGHLMGDRVLQEFAELLKRNLRKGVDVICRYGGEEFIALLPETGLEEACLVAERIRSMCETHVFTDSQFTLNITVSGGVASMTSDQLLTADAFFRIADSMLYKAKQAGRNRIEPRIYARTRLP